MVKLKNYLTVLVFTMLGLSSRVFGAEFQFVGINNLPIDTFIFGGYDVVKGDMLFATGTGRNGGHWAIMNKLTGLRFPEAGWGRVAGFGFMVNQLGQIVVHPYSSFKGAGAQGFPVAVFSNGVSGFEEKIVSTVNPMLPKTNKRWAALLHKEYGRRVLMELAQRTGREIVIDGNILHSERFPYPINKQILTHPNDMELLVKRAVMSWLPDAVSEANAVRPNQLRHRFSRWMRTPVPGGALPFAFGAVVGTVAGESLGPVGAAASAVAMGGVEGVIASGGLRGLPRGMAGGLAGFTGGFGGSLVAVQGAQLAGIEDPAALAFIGGGGGVVGAGVAGWVTGAGAAAAAVPAAVGTVAYLGTRTVDNLAGGRISGTIAWWMANAWYGSGSKVSNNIANQYASSGWASQW